MTPSGLLTHHPLEQIKQSARGHRCFVAVPFIGKGGARWLSIDKGSIVVTNFTREAAEAGMASPDDVLALLKRGVSVYSCADLNARVYVLGRHVAIGSMNASRASLRMVEASVWTSDPALVHAATQFVLTLARDEHLVTATDALSLRTHYQPARRNELMHPRLRPPRTATRAIWFVPVCADGLSEPEAKEAKTAARAARLRMPLDPRQYVDHYVATRWNRSTAVSIGDFVLMCVTEAGTSMLHAPGQVVHVHRFEDRGRPMAVVCLAQRRRRKPIVLADAIERIGSAACVLDPDSAMPIRLRCAELRASVFALWPGALPQPA